MPLVICWKNVDTKLANLHNAVNSLNVAFGELFKDTTKGLLDLAPRLPRV